MVNNRKSHNDKQRQRCYERTYGTREDDTAQLKLNSELAHRICRTTGKYSFVLLVTQFPFFFALSLFFSGFIFTQLIFSLTIILSFRFSFESVQYTRETVIFMCWWWTRWPRNTHTNNRWVSTGDIFIERQFIYQLMADKMLVRCRMFVRIVFNLKIELSAKKVAIGALHLALLCVSWLD